MCDSIYGFRSDIQELFSRFERPDTEDSGEEPAKKKPISLRFSRFSEIWREMNMSFVFNLRLNENDSRDFIEQMYLKVLPYVCAHYPIQRRVCALYLLYSLFVKQPEGIGQPIRLDWTHFDESQDLMAKCKNLGYIEPCYVWHKLWSIGGLDLVHSSRDVSPLYMRYTGDSQHQTGVDPTLKELSHIDQMYCSVKHKLNIEAIVGNNTSIWFDDVLNAYNAFKRLSDEMITKSKSDGSTRTGEGMNATDNYVRGSSSERQMTKITRNHKNKTQNEPNSNLKGKRPRGRPRLK